MKYTILPLFLILSISSLGQKKVNEGSFGIGTYLACPQNELNDINYDDGFGLNISYLSPKFPYKSPINFQLGARMDFAHMRSRKFESIELAQDDGPLIVGDATIKAGNRMSGLFAEGRINFGRDEQKVIPYLSFLMGHRNYTTQQTLSLNRPQDNPEREAESITDRVVHTKRFHYGGSVGLSYLVNDVLSIESSITYTIGERGYVLPLADITREQGSSEVQYNNYKGVRTDILLIHAGVRFNIFKTYSYNPPQDRPNTSSDARSNYRYYDNPRTNNQTQTSKPQTNPSNSSKKPLPIKVKSDGPKKDKNDRS